MPVQKLELLQALSTVRSYITEHYGENSASGEINLITFNHLARLEAQLFAEMAAPLESPAKGG